jgi:hypothetical protein
VSGGEKKPRSYIPDVALIDGALREAFFLPLLGLMVSLLAFVRNVPPCSALDETRSEGGPIALCATEFTVSVSTVIFWVADSAPVFCLRLLKEVLVEGAFGRGVFSWSFSCSFLLSSFFGAVSLSELFAFALPTASAIDLRGVVDPDGTLRSSSDMSKYFRSGLLLLDESVSRV